MSENKHQPSCSHSNPMVCGNQESAFIGLKYSYCTMNMAVKLEVFNAMVKEVPIPMIDLDCLVLIQISLRVEFSVTFLTKIWRWPCIAEYLIFNKHAWTQTQRCLSWTPCFNVDNEFKAESCQEMEQWSCLPINILIQPPLESESCFQSRTHFN